MSSESPYNVAQLYRKLGEAISGGKAFSPGFDAAVRRHRLLDAIERASDTGEKAGSSSGLTEGDSPGAPFTRQPPGPAPEARSCSQY